MLTTKTMMMNWMWKKNYIFVVVVVDYSHFYAHKYQHYCENSMEISNWNKSMTHTTHLYRIHINLINVYTFLYTLHILANPHTHAHKHTSIEHIKNIHMRKEISQKCNVCHVIDFFQCGLKMHITNTRKRSRAGSSNLS